MEPSVLNKVTKAYLPESCTVAMDQGCVVTKEVVISLDDDPR